MCGRDEKLISLSGAIMTTNKNLNRQIEPACKFGPGGEFVSPWPGLADGVYCVSTGPLSRLLAKIASLMRPASPATTSEQEISQQYQPQEPPDYETSPAIPYPASIRNTEISSRISEPSMLFTDDRRTGSGNGNKSNNRVRAHKRAAKKSLTLDLYRQGSLFNSDLTGLRIA
jgi:hypothetical protein